MGKKLVITEQQRNEIKEMYYDFDSPRSIGARGNTFRDKLNTKTDFTGKKVKKKSYSEKEKKYEKSEQQKELEILRVRLEELRIKVKRLKENLEDGYSSSRYSTKEGKWLPNFYTTKEKKEIETLYKNTLREKKEVEDRMDSIEFERDSKIKKPKSEYFGF